MEDALHQQFDSNGFGIVVLFRCDVRWVPRCESGGISCVQNSVVPFQRLRIAPMRGQVSSIFTSFCCPRNLRVVLLHSVIIVHWIEKKSPSGDAMYSHSSTLVLPTVTCILTKVLLLFHLNCDGIQCRCCQSLMACGGDPQRLLLLFRPVAYGTVGCTFVKSDTWLNFS